MAEAEPLLAGFGAVRYGVPADPPRMLLLHGFTGDCRDWSFWPDDAMPAIAVDLPGHGGSTPPSGGFAEEIARLLAALPPSVDRLAGYSLGGRTALALIAAAPSRFVAATIVSAHPGLGAGVAREARRRADRRWIELLRSRGIEAFVDAWERQPLFRTRVDLAAAVRAEQRRRRLNQSAEGLAASLRCFGLAEMPETGKAISDWPGRLCWLVGERDQRFVATADRIARLRPATEVRRVAGAGHNLLLEAPGAVLRACLEP
jgi:2-succinyl-6-hydroxy-2,4-cyclohexadiene-1-carboxylate synthase